MSLPYLKPNPCNGFPFHSGWNKTSLTCPTRPYTIWPLPSHTCPSPTIIYPHVILSVPGMGKASPLLGLPTGCSPAWKIIPHLILLDAYSPFRSQLKSYFCKKVFPGPSFCNLKFGPLFLLSHSQCYFTFIADTSLWFYMQLRDCLISDLLSPHRSITREQGQVDFADHTTNIHAYMNERKTPTKPLMVSLTS